MRMLSLNKEDGAQTKSMNSKIESTMLKLILTMTTRKILNWAMKRFLNKLLLITKMEILKPILKVKLLLNKV